MTALDSALAHHQQGDLKRAIPGYRKFLKKNPNHPVALSYLGLACFEAEKFTEARTHLTRKLNTSGGDAEVYNLLGLVEIRTGNADAALTAFAKAVELAPGFAKGWNNLGNAYRERGQLSDAIQCFENAVAADDGNLLAWENLADSCLEAEEFAGAQHAFETLVARNPGNPGFRAGLANLLDVADPPAAEAHFRAALSLAPENKQIALAYARFLAAQLRHGEALEVIDGLIAASGGHVVELAERARLLKILGRFQEAEAAYREAYRMSPANASLLSDIAALKSFSAGDPDLDLLETRLADPGCDDRERRSLHFGLAKAYGDLGDIDTSFEHLREGNRLKRAEFDFHIDNDLTVMKRIAETFGDWPRLRSEIVGNASDMPVLIVGMPRSGTSLVEQILASHPDVGGGDENLYWPITVDRARFGGRRIHYPGFVAEAPAGEFKAWMLRAADGYLGNLRARAPGTPHVTDKLPLNFLYLGVIALAFPNATIIHCRRDPMDTCFSCYQQEFDGDVPFAWDLTETGRYYLGYRELMAFWQSRFGERILDLEYEALIADQEGETRRLLDYCGLRWAPECLAFHENRRAVSSASFMQVKRPIYQSSKQKWRRYAAHLQPLIDLLGPAGGDA